MKSKNIFNSSLIFCIFVLSFCFTSFAGSWKEEGGTWSYVKEDGSYPVNQWMWVDGNLDGYAECYCFDEDGYCLIDTTTPDGYTVDVNGAWTVNGAVQRRLSVSGTLRYYDKRTGLARLYAQEAGGIILSMYNENVQFAVLNLEPERILTITDGNSEEEYNDKVSQIHFRVKSENVRDWEQTIPPSWRDYQNKKVTIVFLEDKPRFWDNFGGEPLDAVGYWENNVRIYTN